MNVKQFASNKINDVFFISIFSWSPQLLFYQKTELSNSMPFSID
jgi:hypothetical protein